MPQISLSIRHKTYNIECGVGQEKQLQDLGALLEQRMHELAAGSKNATERDLWCMIALVLADELSSEKKRVAKENTIQEKVLQMQKVLDACNQRLQRLVKNAPLGNNETSL